MYMYMYMYMDNRNVDLAPIQNVNYKRRVRAIQRIVPILPSTLTIGPIAGVGMGKVGDAVVMTISVSVTALLTNG